MSNEQKKYANLSTLQSFLDNLKNTFATKTELSAKANATHNHNDTYYTQTQVDTALSQKAQVQIITWEAND